MSLKCPCEVDATHEEREVDGVKVTLDIDIKGKGLIRIRAEGQEPPEPILKAKPDIKSQHLRWQDIQSFANIARFAEES